MADDGTKQLQKINQDTYAVLWNALGLPHHDLDDTRSKHDSADDTVHDLTMPSYKVLVHYQENDLKHDNRIAQTRRHLPRYTIGNICEYRIDDMSHYNHGLLHNISASGCAVGVNRKLTLGRTITILIETGDSRHLPLIIHATVVREMEATHDGLYRYGCQIDRVSNPNV